VLNEAKNYDNLEVKFVPGADPKIIFYDADGNQLTQMGIASMDTQSLHQLLATKGIHRKKDAPEL